MLTDLAAEFALGDMRHDWGKWLMMEAVFLIACYLGGRLANKNQNQAEEP